MSSSFQAHGLQHAVLLCPSPNSWSLLKFMSIELMMPSNHLILCHPLFLLPSIFPSIRVFSNESALHIMWLKYWSFSFSISSSNEYSGLMDLILLSKGLSRFLSKPQFESISSSVLSLLYGPYLTSVHDYWKTVDLTNEPCQQSDVSVFFNPLSRFVIAFLPRASVFNFMTSVIIHRDFRAQENEACHCFHFFSIYLPWWDQVPWP